MAVDLVGGRLQVMRRGRLAQAIRASIAIPGVFAPELLDSMELVDGGVQQYLPVEPLLEFEPDFIIAVQTMKRTPEAGISLIDVASRSMDIVGVEDLARQRALADIVIEPDVDPFSHSDFAKAAELVRAGEQAARAALPQIAARLAGRRPVRARNPVEPRPLATVRSVRLEGLAVTREATLRPLLQTRPGSYLLFQRLREDLVRLFHTGLFEDVNYRLRFGTGDSVDITVELQERAYGFYSLGIRYDNIDNVGLGLEVGQGNLGGSGAGVRAALQVGDPTEFRFGLTGTRLFRLPFGYRLDGFWGKVDRQYYEQGRVQADYGVDYRGGVAEAGYVLGRNAFFKFGLTAYQAGYLVPDRAPPALEALPGSEWVTGPLFRLEYDNRVNPSLPSPGSRVVLDALYATGLFGQRGEMARVELQSWRTAGLGRRVFLSGGWELGYTLGDSLFAEYFRCGADNLPGFGRDEFVSPYKALVQGSFDVRLVDLFGQDAYPLLLGVFAAVATFARPDLLVQRADPLADLNWSAGLALRTDTPVGPVVCRLGMADFAKPESFSYAASRFSLFVSVGRDFRYTR